MRFRVFVLLCLAGILAAGCGLADGGELPAGSRPDATPGPGVPGGSVVVLCYHDIVADPDNGSSGAEQYEDPHTVTREGFAAQMAWLAENGYTLLGLDDLAEGFRTGSFPDRGVLITFDDGYQSFRTCAHPVLREHGFPSVLFPVVSSTPGLLREVIFNEHLTFHDMRWMIQEDGQLAIGSHSYDLHFYHGDTRRAAVYPAPGESGAAYRDRILRDLWVSRELLQLQTDQPVLALAWPYGVWNTAGEAAALAAGFRFLFTLEEAPVTPDTSPRAIPRIAVTSDCLEDFREILALGGMTDQI